MLETTGEGLLAVVPLACAERGISVLPQILRKHRKAQGGEVGLGIGDIAMRVKKRFAGKQHGAAGQTDGGLRPTHDAGVRKAGAALRKAIHVGSEYLAITQRANGVEALVIGE